MKVNMSLPSCFALLTSKHNYLQTYIVHVHCVEDII